MPKVINNAHRLRPEWLTNDEPTSPTEHVTNILGLALTDDEFLAVIQREEPSLAGDHAHFSNLFHVYESIPMDSSKRRVLQSNFDRLQVLGCKVTLLGRNNPSHIAVCLEREHLLRVEQKVFLPN